MRRQAQPGQTKNYVDGEHNRVVRVWLCGGNKEGTGQELLATTHSIRPSNDWNVTTTGSKKQKAQVGWTVFEGDI